MTQEVNKDFESNNIRRFCGKKIESDRVRDHCYLTGKYRGAAHSKCDSVGKKSQRNFTSFILQNFSIYDSHLFFKKSVGEKKDKVKFKNGPKTNEKDYSVTYGCITFFDIFRL